jgi:hypothetical protein
MVLSFFALLLAFDFAQDAVGVGNREVELLGNRCNRLAGVVHADDFLVPLGIAFDERIDPKLLAELMHSLTGNAKLRADRSILLVLLLKLDQLAFCDFGHETHLSAK